MKKKIGFAMIIGPFVVLWIYLIWANGMQVLYLTLVVFGIFLWIFAALRLLA